jgi:hypothetical protein
VVHARKHSGLAEKLFAGLFQDFVREVAIVAYFLYGAEPTREPQIVGQVNGTHSTLTDSFADLVATTQNLPVLERE